MQAKNRKERGEPGNIYHVRNMIGSEKFMWANERIRLRFMDRMYSFRCESFMENRTGLDGTTLHCLETRQAMDPYILKITLTYSLTMYLAN